MTEPINIREHDGARNSRVRIVSFGYTRCANELLGAVIAQGSIFHFCGGPEDWTACEQLLDSQVPEVLITRPGSVPKDWHPDPLTLLLIADSATMASIGDPKVERCEAEMQAELSRIYGTVLLAKGRQLRWLLRNYHDGLARKDYADFIEARRNGTRVNVAVAKIEWIEGAGNWVRLHSAGDTFELRELMSDLVARLSPAQFIRIHRSTIVNRSQVGRVLTRSRAPVAVQTSSGILLPIGSTFRDSARLLAPGLQYEPALTGTEQ